MRIKCINNRISILPQLFLEFYGDRLHAPLIVDKSYMVYAVYEKFDTTLFCIYDELHCSPRWHPRFFFEISDPRLSKYWIFNFWNDSQDVPHPILAFPEWANDEYFYGDLIDGDGERETLDIFHKYEKLMYLEFPDPAVIERAQIGDEEWLICPCIDAWKSNTQDALVTCPKCKTMLNNPRYKNELPSYKQASDN